MLLVPRMPSLPPSTYPGVCTIVMNMSKDCLMHASVQGISPATHWSYRSGPHVLRTICEIQSVSAQPPPPEIGATTEKGVRPSATIVSASSIISSQVEGTP